MKNTGNGKVASGYWNKKRLKEASAKKKIRNKDSSQVWPDPQGREPCCLLAPKGAWPPRARTQAGEGLPLHPREGDAAGVN